MKNKIYQHDKYVKAFKSIRALVTADLGQFMIFLIGVSRVGKTTLQEDLLKSLPRDWDGKVVRFEAPPKMTAQFSIRPFLLRYLEHIGDPFSALRVRSYARMKTHELIELIVRRIRQKGVKLVIVDESDLFVTVRGDAQAYENLQFLKSLVNITGIPHLFAGTPPLAEFLAMEGQVINRSHVVRLTPYNYDNDEHVKIYLQVLKKFEKSLTVPLNQELKKDPIVLFQATNGCIGALKELLVRMEAMAIAHEQDTISAQLISTFGFYDPNNIRAEEIEEFNNLSTSNKSEQSVSTKPEPNPNKEATKERKWHRKPSRRKPGQRKSHADKVGGAL
jgi:hypothetical protein